MSVLCIVRNPTQQNGGVVAKGNRRRDGYPTVSGALAAVAGEVSDEDTPVIQLTVQLLASGEVTYRVHRRGDDEGEGGYILLDNPAQPAANSKS